MDGTESELEKELRYLNICIEGLIDQLDSAKGRRDEIRAMIKEEECGTDEKGA
jgi:hypothetical protein